MSKSACPSWHHLELVGWHGKSEHAAIVPMDSNSHPCAHVCAIDDRAKRAAWHSLWIVHGKHAHARASHGCGWLHKASSGKCASRLREGRLGDFGSRTALASIGG